MLGLHEWFVPHQQFDQKKKQDKEVDESLHCNAISVTAVAALNDLARRQAVSEWIRYNCFVFVFNNCF